MIYNGISFYETKWFNGYLLLIHLHVHPNRIDKFYNYLDELIDVLKIRDINLFR